MNLKTNRRIIITSDIHGNLVLFKKLLDKVKFNKKDILIINGDIYEKGLENLDTLEYLMNLIKEYTIYIIKGNCDLILAKLKYINRDTFNFFAFRRGCSVINEMANRLNITLTPDIDLSNLNKLYYNNFKKYYDFANEFIDYIVLNDKYYISHKGNTENILNKLPIIDNGYINISGHKPSILYNSNIPSFNPYYYDSNNLFIDGANNVSPFGQLNYIIINNDLISMDYVSSFNKFISKIDYNYNNGNAITTNSIIDNLTFIKEEGEFLYYKVKDNIVISHNSEVRKDKFCYFATNYFISLIKGAEYEICKMTDTLCVIKYKGITGYVERGVLDYAI